MAAKTENRAREIAEAVESQRGKLRNAIGGRVRDHAEAEDVFQEVVVELLEAYDVGTAIENLGAWLVTVAKNKIFDRFRRKRVRESHVPAAKAEGDDEFARTWLRRELADAIEMLPAEQREAWVKHELEGKSFEQIAKETGVSVNTALSRKRYATLYLRERLKEIYEELS